jgi:UDP-2-acetamido-3-amino-2,3-dideoxy-glucuronate N-acetyltransferase
MLTWIIRKVDYMRRGIKIWKPCNVYKSAILGNGVSVGMFSEIGNRVVVGENTRIGMGTFIPEGVVIGKNCFIGPKVCMIHDKTMTTPPFPPSHKRRWQGTIVEDEALIGANALILPGIVIHRGAVVGMGSVVTKDVGAYEVWAGNPAKKIRNLKEDSDG